jgi:hypothetical protein
VSVRHVALQTHQSTLTGVAHFRCPSFATTPLSGATGHGVQVPLLEMVGARALALAISEAPFGHPSPSAAVTDAKAIATHQGAVSALVRLLQLAMSRYVAVHAGTELPQAAYPLAQLLDDDPAKFTRNMATHDGAVDTLYYAAAAMLNLSTNRVNQVVLAKRGLRTILGAQALMLSLAHGLTALDARERRIAEVLVGTVQNLAQHPQNRTRFYKAELRGALALQQELLGLAPEERSPSPTRVAPSLPPAPRPMATGAEWRPRTWVAGGVVALNKSIDSALIKHIRPKALFPAIVRPGLTGDGSGGAQTSAVAGGATRPSANVEDTVDSMREPTMTALFTAWSEGTFQGGLDEGPEAEVVSKVTRMVDPSTGDWHKERSGFPLLNAALRRPTAAMWGDSQGARAQRGFTRWRPAISEYQQDNAGADAVCTNVTTARLLRTDAPEAAAAGGLLLAAAQDMVASGALAEGLPLLKLRPSTAERRGGRLSLTVLKPSVANGTVQAAQQPARAVRCAMSMAGSVSKYSHFVGVYFLVDLNNTAMFVDSPRFPILRTNSAQTVHLVCAWTGCATYLNPCTPKPRKDTIFLHTGGQPHFSGVLQSRRWQYPPQGCPVSEGTPHAHRLCGPHPRVGRPEAHARSVWPPLRQPCLRWPLPNVSDAKRHRGILLLHVWRLARAPLSPCIAPAPHCHLLSARDLGTKRAPVEPGPTGNGSQ